METQKDELSVAVATLIKYLREDEDYFRSWKDNISITFQDEFWNNIKSHRDLDLMDEQNTKKIFNIAATNFLNLLIYVDRKSDPEEVLYPRYRGYKGWV